MKMMSRDEPKKGLLDKLKFQQLKILGQLLPPKAYIGYYIGY